MFVVLVIVFSEIFYYAVIRFKNFYALLTCRSTHSFYLRAYYGRLSSTKFNLVPVPELAKAPLWYKFDCFMVSSYCGERKEKRNKEMKMRFTSIREKNVYNIIKVIPSSFYRLHYASILPTLVTVLHPPLLHSDRPTKSYLPCPSRCLLNRIVVFLVFYCYTVPAMAITWPWVVAILY